MPYHTNWNVNANAMLKKKSKKINKIVIDAITN